MPDPLPLPAPFTLGVPGFPQAWTRARANGQPRLPDLERMVRRGLVSRRVVPSGSSLRQAMLLSSLHLDYDAAHASAPLEWLGLGGEPRAGSWVKAGLVHIEMGSHDARVHPLDDLGLDAARLGSALVSGLQFPGLSVLASPDPARFAGVFVHSEAPLEVACPWPAPGEPVDLRDVLPQGREGPILRRLFTEAQMVLHDHPANVARERRKQRVANAVWLGGVGEYHGIVGTALPAIVSGDPLAQGLCRLHGAEARPLPESFTRLASTLPTVVDLPVPSGDPADALAQLERNWFAPLAAAVASGRVAEAVLHLGDLAVRIDRRNLRRFWRRGPALGDLF
jgi:hypothetical protein